VKDAPEPFRPILIFGKEDDPIAAGLPPSFEKMERQHA
jgi:hypothetical protein